MATTPEEWLPVLAKRMDERMPDIRLLKQYADCDAPLPEADRNTREAWRRFQKQARTNWAVLIREAVADRIVPNGITVGGSSESVEAKRAQEIWLKNRMDSVFKDWLRHGLDLGESYMTVWSGETPIITADSPETMCVSTDPLQPWRVRAALRVWRDIDVGKDFAFVWMNGARQKFQRDCYAGNRRKLVRTISGDWEPVADVYETTGAPPVVLYRNPGGKGEFEAQLDLIDRINGGILRRLSIESMLAFRARALRSKEGGPGLPKVDANGNAIDWAAALPFAPGALWNLPPGVDVWESIPTDINPLLSANKDDIRQLSSDSRTPLPMLMPDNAGQSAKGAAATESGYLSKCSDRLREAKVGGTAVLIEALKSENVELDETLELSFEPVEMVSLSEKMGAAAQAAAAGVPRKTIWRNVLGWSPEQISQADTDLADEALLGLLKPPGPSDSTSRPIPR